MFKTLICSAALVGFLVSAQQSLPAVARAGLFNRPYTAPPPFGVAAAYNQATPYVPILDYSNEINIDGSYRYSFVTADGKQAEESGYLKDVSVNNLGEPVGVQVVQGSYSYTAPDGTPVQVTYIADENGFQPTSVRVPADGRLGVPPINPLVGRVNPLVGKVNPAVARANPFATSFRKPYNAGALVGRYNAPYLD